MAGALTLASSSRVWCAFLWCCLVLVVLVCVVGLLVWLLPFFWLVGLVFAFFAGVWLVCFCLCFWLCLFLSFRLSFLLCLSCWFSFVLGCSLACSVVPPLSLGFSCEIFVKLVIH